MFGGVFTLSHVDFTLIHVDFTLNQREINVNQREINVNQRKTNVNQREINATPTHDNVKTRSWVKRGLKPHVITHQQVEICNKNCNGPTFDNGRRHQLLLMPNITSQVPNNSCKPNH